MSAPAELTPRPMPALISIPLILLCLVGGGWIIHWYLATNSLTAETAMLGDVPVNLPAPANRDNGNRERNPRNPDPGRQNSNRYIRATNAGWTAKTETAQVRFKMTGRNGRATITYFIYEGDSWAPDAARKTKNAAYNLAHDAKATEALKLTAQQIQDLQNLSGSIQIAADNTSKEELVTTFLGWESATDKAPAQEKLWAQIDEVAKKFLAPTRQELLDRAAKIDKIMTPELWAQSAKLGHPGN